VPLQISTDCPGATYGRLFHQLLLERGLLLLGLYRPVQQGGLNFSAAITNPRYVSTAPLLSDALHCITLHYITSHYIT
jgi:hypothetical protein